MSLYGDLPPPSTDPEASTSTTSPSGSTSTSTTPVKSALPAGWSASVTRFKPMLNRKLAPPKPKPARSTIPAGFVVQDEPQLNSTSTPTTTTTTTTAPSTVGATATATATTTSAAANVQTVYLAAPTVTQSSVAGTAAETVAAVDETSWLKARTAQVQRQESDHSHIKRQTKQKPPKGLPAPLSLDDDYEIARPNDYEEFKGLLMEERRIQAEEREHLRRMNRLNGNNSNSRRRTSMDSDSRSRSRSRSRTNSRSRSRSRSYSRSVSRSPSPPPRSRSGKRSSFSRSRSRSRSRSGSPSRSRRPHDRDYSRSPRSSAAPRMPRSSRSKSHVRRSRSPSPLPPNSSRRRSRSISPRIRSSRRSMSPSSKSPPRSIAFKSFAPPPSSEPPKHTPPSSGTVQPIVWNDTSGEDAFLRRAQLGKQNQMVTAPRSIPQSGPNARIQQHLQQQGGPPGIPPSSVILLTNMVGPGEVDDTLQEETAAECEKFGPVVRCLIYEVKNRTVPPEEAVRIFVKFGALSSATRAMKDLDGRFFGGRQVRGQFFDEKRFDLLQLAP